MKTEIVQTLITIFEAHAQQTDGGIEYWLARDLQHLLGYDEWRNFIAVIYTMIQSCRRCGINPQEYLTGILQRLPSMTTSQVPVLLPHRWQPTRSAYRLQKIVIIAERIWKDDVCTRVPAE